MIVIHSVFLYCIFITISGTVLSVFFLSVPMEDGTLEQCTYYVSLDSLSYLLAFLNSLELNE